MKRLFRILLTNAWRGLRRTGALPTTVVILVSVTVLLFIISNVAAVAFPHIFPQISPKHSIAHKEHPISILGSTKNSGQQAKGNGASISNGSSNSDNKLKPGSTAKSTENVNVYPNKGSGDTAAPKLILNQRLCTPSQTGSQDYTVQNAALTYPSGFTAETVVGLKVETASDSGTPPDPSTISLSQTSQTTSVKSTNIIFFNQSNSSLPLVTAPAGVNGIYKFRLDAIINGSNFAESDWMTIPSAVASCQQN